MTSICITKYNAMCNIGNNISEISESITNCGNSKLICDNTLINNETFYFGKINFATDEIKDKNYNTRANQLMKHCIKDLNIKGLINKYDEKRIGIVLATTNSGIEEYINSKNKIYSEIGNPSDFLKQYLSLKSYSACISTACSSGIKVFGLAKKLIDCEICDAVIVGGVDSLARIAIHGFNSLEVLSHQKSNPFSKNRNGINIGEAVALFTIEKSTETSGIKILGIGESSDAYHISTPNPDGEQAAIAIKKALKEANLSPDEIDYINLHGTGTQANDLMEANAINKVFNNTICCSSTKPITGHCLGASGALETAICCEAITKNYIPPHIYDEKYDTILPKLNLITTTVHKKITTVLNNAFGFGGTNSVIILGK